MGKRLSSAKKVSQKSKKAFKKSPGHFVKKIDSRKVKEASAMVESNAAEEKTLHKGKVRNYPLTWWWVWLKLERERALGGVASS